MDTDKLGPQIPEPTDEEINGAIIKLKTKYDIYVSKEDAVEYVNLTNELGWWLNAEKEFLSKEDVGKTATQEAKDFVKRTNGEDISSEKAGIEAEKSLIQSIPHEKDRLANEIRSLIAKYK